jgi:hypothetical protein
MVAPVANGLGEIHGNGTVQNTKTRGSVFYYSEEKMRSAFLNGDHLPLMPLTLSIIN